MPIRAEGIGYLSPSDSVNSAEGGPENSLLGLTYARFSIHLKLPEPLIGILTLILHTKPYRDHVWNERNHVLRATMWR